MTRPAANSGELRTISDVTCLACGCLCDDLAVQVAGGRVVAVEHACDRGRAWFSNIPPGEAPPKITVEGRAAARDEALDRAAAILSNARCPLITGLDATTIEAQRVAVALADRIGATIDPARSNAHTLAAFQRVGRVGGTLGEVTARADVVLYWDVDPVTTHPRHWERHIAPPGRFVPTGRAGRTVFVATTNPDNATAGQSDGVLALTPDRTFETLWCLRALARGININPEAVLRSCGREAANLASFVDRLRAARYGVVFFGANLAPAATAEALFLLVRDLNMQTRFVAIPLGSQGNPAGADAVLSWQTGYAAAVDFSRGFPRFLPTETSAEARLARRQADAVVIVGDDPEGLSDPARSHLTSIPRIVIASDATGSARAATVGLTSSLAGLECGGTVARADGVMLPLRAVLEPSAPSDRDWLGAVSRRLISSGADR